MYIENSTNAERDLTSAVKHRVVIIMVWDIIELNNISTPAPCTCNDLNRIQFIISYS